MFAKPFQVLLAAVLAAIVLVALGGCGQKGDLYLPDEPQSFQP